MFLVDSNIFLEVLLNQRKKSECKKFLSDNIENLHVTDFSLHSIGVILFKYGNEKDFVIFAEDVLPKIKVLTLPINRYVELGDIKKEYNLDFDDAYQCLVSRYYKLKIVTMDSDYKKAKGLDLIFL